jgi:hypothetical protein
MEERVSLARSAAIRFLDGLRSDDNSSIYTFDSKVSLIQEFSNQRDVTDHLFDLKANGMTVIERCDLSGSRRAIKASGEKACDHCLVRRRRYAKCKIRRKSGEGGSGCWCTIYTVDMSSTDTGGPRRQQNQSILKSFSDKTGGFFIATPGGTAMREAFTRIVTSWGLNIRSPINLQIQRRTANGTRSNFESAGRI